MAKHPEHRPEPRRIEAGHQQSAALHEAAEAGHRAILEQAMAKQVQDQSAQRAKFDRALALQTQAAEARQQIIHRALAKTRCIESTHRAILQKALDQTHQSSLSQSLLTLSKIRQRQADNDAKDGKED